MTKAILIIVVTLLFGCSVQVEHAQPSICLQHPGQEFSTGTISCDVHASEKCAFDPHGEPTALDGSGSTPVSYVCDCTTSDKYYCWGSPGLAPAVTQ